eukprot:Clim_evm5s23 gene=Clim_evmTU5s23
MLMLRSIRGPALRALQTRLRGFKPAHCSLGLHDRKCLYSQDANRDPLNTYLHRVNAGHLIKDDQQVVVLAYLLGLHNALHKNFVAQPDLLVPPPPPDQSEAGEADGTVAEKSEITSKPQPIDFTILRPEGVPKSFYLHGEVGCGKTMIMDVFYDTLQTRKKRRDHFYAFMQDVYGYIHKWNTQINDSDKVKWNKDPLLKYAADIASEAAVICFDEFQVTDVASAVIVNRLFTNLIRAGVVFVVTSNRHPDKLFQGGLNREKNIVPFIATIKANFDVKQMTGSTDYRSVMLLWEKAQPVHNGGKADEEMHLGRYLTPNDQTTHNVLEEIWTRVTNGKDPKPRTIERKGNRPITLERFASGTTLFTFEELCGSGRNPMGPGDFLNIARHCHSVFIKDIPILTFKMKNQARRLITLIDALYEYNCHLYCTAEAEPEKLFAPVISARDVDDLDDDEDKQLHLEMMVEIQRELKVDVDVKSLSIFTGEDEIFAFRRCASRLNEMQTNAYRDRPHRGQALNV